MPTHHIYSSIKKTQMAAHEKPGKICNADSYITFRLVVEISKTRHLQRKVLCILNDEYVCGNAALLIYVCRRRFFY